MFRVPESAEAPTFDHTFKVSFWRWLTSKAPERREWIRRRNAAATAAKSNQDTRVQEFVQERIQKHQQGHDQG